MLRTICCWLCFVPKPGIFDLVNLTNPGQIVCGNFICIMILVSFQQTLHFEETQIIFQHAILSTQQTHFNHFTQS